MHMLIICVHCTAVSFTLKEYILNTFYTQGVITESLNLHVEI